MKTKSINEEVIDLDFHVVDEDEDDKVQTIEDDLDFDIEDMIEESLKRRTKFFESNLKKMNSTLKNHDSRITNLEKQQKVILEELAKISGKDLTPAEVEKAIAEIDDRNVLDKTLGAVGGVLHGVVDTAAFVLESTVDLVTLGRAKREH